MILHDSRLYTILDCIIYIVYIFMIVSFRVFMSPDCILHLYDGIKDKNIYPHDFMLEYNCIHP